MWRKIKINTEKIDEIVTSINNMKDIINGSKLLIKKLLKLHQWIL